jgi:putative ABC transport system substrate-binding protein
MIRRREFIAGLGSAAAWPLAARAQQPALPVIGYLDWNAPRPKAPFVEALRAGLAEAGFIEGRNLTIEYRWGDGDYRQLPALAADLVRRQVAVIVAVGSYSPPRAAKDATSTIPIVFIYGGDPVKDGFVASLNRPGSNVTGMTGFAGDLGGKRLDLLRQMVPRAKIVGYLSGDASFIYYERLTSQMFAAGRALGVEIMIVECRSDSDFEAALEKMVRGGAEALILDTFAFSSLDKVVSLAALHKIPAMYPSRQLAQAGGLMSYDANPVSDARRLGSAYVARILKGEKPADIPVEQPTKFDLVINLKTAKALGLIVPPTLLALADEVIE